MGVMQAEKRLEIISSLGGDNSLGPNISSLCAAWASVRPLFKSDSNLAASSFK